jgi:hypothetical protein
LNMLLMLSLKASPVLVLKVPLRDALFLSSELLTIY